MPQIALAYVLHYPLDIYALVGSANAEEIAANIVALNTPLTPQEMAYLDLRADSTAVNYARDGERYLKFERRRGAAPRSSPAWFCCCCAWSASPRSRHVRTIICFLRRLPPKPQRLRQQRLSDPRQTHLPGLGRDGVCAGAA